MPSRAFLLESTKVDTSPASDYGRVVPLFDGPRTSLFDSAIVSQIQSKLLDYEYDPNEDYIVASGDLAAVSVLIGSAAQLWESIRLLIWDPRNGGAYQLLEITSESA